MDSAKSQLADKLKSSNNVLVTVSRDPSVDQLSALLGLTLLLNKMGKHAAAVFSGEVPSTIEFLQPEDTFEKNTDSLRDFIIALDKSKADKLRYKVEDNVVRIFITPYRTSITQEDLDFSQGDFNVDIVVALGVSKQEDLDEAITAHGRILHDATVATLTTREDGGLGGINWHDPHASSLSELVTELSQLVGKELVDGQIATALLTGIVAETDRFSNDRTSSQTMSASATLMAAGANQQLVASKLEPEPWEPGNSKEQGGNADKVDGDAKSNDGTLEIEHTDEPEAEAARANDSVTDTTSNDSTDEDEISDVKAGFELPPPEEPAVPTETAIPAEPQPSEDAAETSSRPMMTEPPSMGGTLTSNAQESALDPSTDPMGLPTEEPPQLLDRPASGMPTLNPLETEPEATEVPAATTMNPAPADWVPPAAPEPVSSVTSEPAPPDAPDQSEPASPAASEPIVPDAPSQPEPAPEAPNPPEALNQPESPPEASSPEPTPEASPPLDDKENQTLTDLEASVDSPHLSASDLDVARDEVSKALSSATTVPPEPIHALNAQQLGADLHSGDDIAAPPAETSSPPSLEAQIPGLATPTPFPPAPATEPAPEVVDPNAPPPVPPPLPITLNSPPRQQ